MVTVPKLWLKKKKNSRKNVKILDNFQANTLKKVCSKFTHIQMKNHARKENLVELQCFDIL